MIPEPNQTWGVLGGAFDPVHNGHLSLALGAIKSAQLDGVVLVPTFSPPHRDNSPQASFLERLAMVFLACQGHDQLEISDIESELPEPSYSIHTIAALKEQHPGVNWCFLIGSDNLGMLPEWHRIDELVKDVRFLVGKRPGNEIVMPQLAEHAVIEPAAIDEVDVAATELRDLLKSDRESKRLAELVPAEVLSFILQKGLYRD